MIEPLRNKYMQQVKTALKTRVKHPDMLHSEVAALREEVRVLRSAMVSVIGKDKEGEYRPEFVRQVLQAAGEKSTYLFKNAKSFLSELERV